MKQHVQKLKVFRTFCLAILQFFVNFFLNCQEQQHFAVFFCEIGANLKKTIRQKLIPQKVVLEKDQFFSF